MGEIFVLGRIGGMLFIERDNMSKFISNVMDKMLANFDVNNRKPDLQKWITDYSNGFDEFKLVLPRSEFGSSSKEHFNKYFTWHLDGVRYMLEEGIITEEQRDNILRSAMTDKETLLCQWERW